MKSIIKKIFDFREGESAIASLMFGYIFLIIAVLMIVKPVRNSMFLVHFGVEQLPYVFIMVAFFAAIITWISTKHSEKIQLNNMIIATLLVSMTSLIGFWYLFYSGYSRAWVVYAFYIWVSIFGIMATTQFWLLANYIFNAREAKRLFGFIGAGAISGGISGGYLTNFLAPRINTENLIFVGILLLLMCLALFGVIWKKASLKNNSIYSNQPSHTRNQIESVGAIKLIYRSRHLAYLAGITSISVVIANLVDYQFSAIAADVIEDEDKLTAFFGFWMSNLNVASLIFQLLLTGKIIKNYGVIMSLFFLPIGLIAGSGAVLISPGLWSAIVIKLSDGGFKHSINKAGMELLASPIPPNVRRKAKLFIDGVLDNLATGLAGIILLAATLGLGITAGHISLINLGLLVIWIYFIVKIRSEYVNSFRQAIEKRTIDPGRQSLSLDDASVFNHFLKVLDSKNERQILYVLHLIEGVSNRKLIPHLKELINHPSADVKVAVLKMASAYKDLDLSQPVHNLINSSDLSVRIEAINYLLSRTEDILPILSRYLDHDDMLIRSAALICLGLNWQDLKENKISISAKDILDKLLANRDPKAERQPDTKFIDISIARFIGIVNEPELNKYLGDLLQADRVEVVKAAIDSAGRIESLEFSSVLIGYLNTRNYRKEARTALSRFKNIIINNLSNHFEDVNSGFQLRRQIPKVLELIQTQQSVDILLDNISQPDTRLRIEILKSLNKLRQISKSLKFHKNVIAEQIDSELNKIYRNTVMTHTFSSQSPASNLFGGTYDNSEIVNQAVSLLKKTLADKTKQRLEHLFRLLALIYAPKEIHDAYLGIIGQNASLKANALEYLENILSSSLRKLIIPVLDTRSINTVARDAEVLLDIKPLDQAQTINYILDCDDNWMKACAIHLLAAGKLREFKDRIQKLSSDPDPIIRETVRRSLKILA